MNNTLYQKLTQTNTHTHTHIYITKIIILDIGRTIYIRSGLYSNFCSKNNTPPVPNVRAQNLNGFGP